MNRNERILASSLLVVAAALLLVGIVSGTIIRHIVQVVPVVAVGAVVLRRHDWSRGAAIPVLAFWLLIMVLIWLHLLGVAHVVTGRFKASEVVLTIVIGVSSVLGLGASVLMTGPRRWGVNLAGFLGFGTLQVGAVWLSVRPAIANH